MLSKSTGRNGMTITGKKATGGNAWCKEVEELGNQTNHTQMVGGELSSLSQKTVLGSMGLSHICDAPSKHLLR